MSPLLMSMSSSKVTVTLIGANASSTGPSNVSTDFILELKPLGSTNTLSPGLKIPPDILPA